MKLLEFWHHYGDYIILSGFMLLCTTAGAWLRATDTEAWRQKRVMREWQRMQKESQKRWAKQAKYRADMRVLGADLIVRRYER